MSTTVKYKGNTLTTVSNATKTLKTAGKYMEGDVVLTDVSASANVWQDENGYVHLDDEGTSPISVEALSVTQNGTYTAPTGKAYSPVTVNVSGGGGLEYEEGTWTPSEDTKKGTILFSNSHNTIPMFITIIDAREGLASTNDILMWTFSSWYNAIGTAYNTTSATASNYGVVNYAYKTSNGVGSSSAFIAGLGSATYQMEYWATNTGFYPAYGTGSSSYYWRAGCIYKWIAVWAPTT